MRHDGDTRFEAHTAARGPAGLLLQCRLQGEVHCRSRQVHLAFERRRRLCAPGVAGSCAPDTRRHRLHLPNAPGSSAGSPGRLPQVRHGTRTRDAVARRRRGPGADGLQAPLFLDVAPDRGGFRACHGRSPTALVRACRRQLDRIRTDDAGRAVGGMALFRARGEVDRQSQPEHVDADRPGDRRRVCLQRRRHGGAWRVPDVLRVDGTRLGLLRGGGRHHFAHFARPVDGIASTFPDLGSHQVAAGACAQDGPTDQCRWCRRGCAPDTRSCRRFVARATRREGARRRGRARGQQRGGRIDADRRTHAGQRSRLGARRSTSSSANPAAVTTRSRAASIRWQTPS